MFFQRNHLEALNLNAFQGLVRPLHGGLEEVSEDHVLSQLLIDRSVRFGQFLGAAHLLWVVFGESGQHGGKLHHFPDEGDWGEGELGEVVSFLAGSVDGKLILDEVFAGIILLGDEEVQNGRLFLLEVGEEVLGRSIIAAIGRIHLIILQRIIVFGRNITLLLLI